jgi:hypothetical protein
MVLGLVITPMTLSAAPHRAQSIGSTFKIFRRSRAQFLRRVLVKELSVFSGLTLGLSFVSDGPAVYRPRHPERTASYQILDEHFETYVRVHEERFEPRSGPLRSVVRATVEAFLNCGLLQNAWVVTD